MVKYKCDCDQNGTIETNTKLVYRRGYGVMTETEVDGHGFCIYCGHVAVASNDHVVDKSFQFNGRLFYHVTMLRNEIYGIGVSGKWNLI
jgi:hypothetical protein